jgi:hypothetical protein
MTREEEQGDSTKSKTTGSTPYRSSSKPAATDTLVSGVVGGRRTCRRKCMGIKPGVLGATSTVKRSSSRKGYDEHEPRITRSASKRAKAQAGAALEIQVGGL